MVPKSEALPKMDDKHALHVDEVHMKPTMPRPQKLLIKLQSHFGNGTLERPPYAQVNPWDQPINPGVTWRWVGLVVMDSGSWGGNQKLRPKHNFVTKIRSFFISQKSRQYDSTMVLASCSCAWYKTVRCHRWKQSARNCNNEQYI